MREIMRLDPRQPQWPGGPAQRLRPFGTRQQASSRSLHRCSRRAPPAYGLRDQDRSAAADSCQQIAALGSGRNSGEGGMRVRKNRAHAHRRNHSTSLRAAQENAAQHQRRPPFGMRLRISQRQRRPPGAAEQQPPLDAQKLRSVSMSSTRCGVVFASRLPSGLDRPAPRWSKIIDAPDMRGRRTADAPPRRRRRGRHAGTAPACRAGCPTCSQYITCPSDSGR